MPVRLLVLLTMALLGWTAGSAGAEPPGNPPPGADTGRSKATSYASLMAERGGDRVLLIDYPWRVYRRPSVEVRLVTARDAKPSAIRPLYFVREYMKGEVAVRLYRCEDEAASGPVRKPLIEKRLSPKKEEEEAGFEIVGRRNSLGRLSVCVVERLPPRDPAPGTVAVFCMLPEWALGKRLLYLDLPRDEFSEPGKMYVWFLRDETVLWKETLDWPGYKGAGVTKAE